MSNDCCNHGAGKKHSATVAGLLERPLYTPGLILEDSDLTAAVDYTRELNRLLFSQLFGCGVVCGLRVSVGGNCELEVTIAPGLALDGCGDPLQVTKPVTISLGRGDGVLPLGPGERPKVERFWVMLCGREKRCAPRATVCDGDGFDAVREATRARALSEVSISFTHPDGACGCAPPTEKERLDPYYYLNLINRLPRAGTSAQVEDDAVIDRCQAEHESRVECADDCGGGSACSCGCCVLLALVCWFPEEQAWGVLHKDVRRFIRPKLLPDPIEDQRPVSTVAAPAEAPQPPPVNDPKGSLANESDVAVEAAPAADRLRKTKRQALNPNA